MLDDSDNNPIAIGTFDWENTFDGTYWTYAQDELTSGIQAAYASLKADVERRYGVTLHSLGAMREAGLSINPDFRVAVGTKVSTSYEGMLAWLRTSPKLPTAFFAENDIMGYHPYNFVAGFDDEDHLSIHRRFAALLEAVFDEICAIKQRAAAGDASRPFYPMIIFRTPKGWTCPKEIDGKKTEGSWRAHQVPLASARDTEAHFQVLKGWLASYEPEELFDGSGAIRPEVTEFMPQGELRLGGNPNANGGLLLQDLVLPDIRAYEVDVEHKGHGFGATEATRVLGEYTAELINSNRDMLLAKWLGLEFVQEVIASKRAVETLIPQTDCAIELGGEDAKIIYFDNGIEQRMNGTCAGGTGAFIDQMASLMVLALRFSPRTP